VYIKINSQ